MIRGFVLVSPEGQQDEVHTAAREQQKDHEREDDPFRPAAVFAQHGRLRLLRRRAVERLGDEFFLRLLLGRFGGGRLGSHLGFRRLWRNHEALHEVFIEVGRVEWQFGRQIFGEVGALEDQQGQAGVDGRVGAGITASLPVTVARLVSDQDFRAPAIPVPVADRRQVVKHSDALQRPEVIQVVHGQVDHAARRYPDHLAQGEETVEDARVLHRLVVRPRLGVGEAVADRQADQSDARHGPRRGETQGLGSAAEAVVIGPGAVGILARQVAPDD